MRALRAAVYSSTDIHDAPQRTAIRRRSCQYAMRSASLVKKRMNDRSSTLPLATPSFGDSPPSQPETGRWHPQKRRTRNGKGSGARGSGPGAGRQFNAGASPLYTGGQMMEVEITKVSDKNLHLQILHTERKFSWLLQMFVTLADNNPFTTNHYLQCKCLQYCSSPFAGAS